MRHFLSVQQLTKEQIMDILQSADTIKQAVPALPQQLFAANLFFEPSTRTRMSFTAAEKRLGMEVLDFQAAGSSTEKGESFYDTVKTFEAIGANLLVIRHPSDDWASEIPADLSIPVINGGAGKREHPTQCLLDLLTIYQEFGRFQDLQVVIAGDIKHSRVARSNAFALKRLGANVHLSAPPGMGDPELSFPYISMDQAVKNCDVLMLLRVQRERHETEVETVSYLQQYGLTLEREEQMKIHAIVMHPAPVNRGMEIDATLMECGRSRIFKQMENGVYIRMAVIANILQEWGILDETAFNKCEAAGGKGRP
ncbi:aspartate carbamoyltransferase catalytic subunit [Lentibacillus sediminis]|uniref:aspartate carbamoyltransferase catalytic subunit n=1 Tax=Lentibacillus sediminis TaxID=1940529 RepID=UPI000C1C7DF2|nr:aspartate carbamoyltransferase catalytic subunit [Lentibacillus sediminis]